MKKKYFFLFLLFSYNAFSQTSKKELSVGLKDFAFYNKYPYINYKLNPSIGYFVGKNIEIGLAYYFEDIRNENNRKKTSYITSAIFPYITKYFGNKKLQPFILFGYGIDINLKKIDGHYYNVDYIQLNAGVQYSLTPSIYIGGHLSNSYYGWLESGVCLNYHFITKKATK